ncbi:MAG: DUF2867 domain-containing protein [Actinomycetes bacterium]
MRLPDTAHTSQAWRIHEIAPDFRLEDVWALPTPGGPDDFGDLVAGALSLRVEQSSSRVFRGLFAVRWKLGEVFGWDRPVKAADGRVPTLRDRLPTDLRDAARPAFTSLPFSSLYVTDTEFAAEAANATMHGVLHFGWVPDGAGGYRGQMAVLVKPNGVLGRLYMAGIAPFRHLIIYPQLLRDIGRMWQTRGRDPAPSERSV